MNVYLKFVKNVFGAIISSHSDNYPTPINLSYFWGIGSLAGIALIIQLVSGILLAMHYTPEVNLAFISVEHIMRDVVGGSGLRYIHANGASMFFIVVYAHMFRGLYYGSYYQPRSLLWYTGVIIFLLMMATAFMGYVLPWGQMSFWGATVITNLFSAIPYIGNYIVQLLWGGFSVDNPTLNRFFSLHYLMPFIIAALAGLHLALLHKDGSNNPLGIESSNDKISFLPYFYVKDFFGVCLFALFFSFFVIYAPNYLGHPDNYIEANPMVTPAHIVPEWYFLPFYAILRTIPDKLGGVALMVFAIVILLFLPNLDNSYIRSTYFKPFHLIMFWGFLSICLILGWIGQEVVETPFIELSLFVTPAYFIYFLFLIPFFSNIERIIIDQNFIRFYVNQLKKNDFNFNKKKLYSVSLINPFTSEFISDICFDFFGFFYNIINICLIIFFVIILSLILPTRAKSVKVINLLSTFYLIVLFYFNFFNFNSSTLYLQNGNLFNLNWFFILFFFLITFLVGIFFLSISSVFYLEENYKVEYNFLVFFLYLNAILLLFVTDFISVIIILECIAFSSYIMVGFETKNKYSVSSGIKYLIWGSMPAGFFILGLSFLYYGFGTFNQNFLEILLISNEKINKDLNFTDTDIDLAIEIFIKDALPDFAKLREVFNYTYKNEIFKDIMLEYTYEINKLCWYYNPSVLKDLFSQLKNFNREDCTETELINYLKVRKELSDFVFFFYNYITVYETVSTIVFGHESSHIGYAEHSALRSVNAWFEDCRKAYTFIPESLKDVSPFVLVGAFVWLNYLDIIIDLCWDFEDQSPEYANTVRQLFEILDIYHDKKDLINLLNAHAILEPKSLNTFEKELCIQNIFEANIFIKRILKEYMIYAEYNKIFEALSLNYNLTFFDKEDLALLFKNNFYIIFIALICILTNILFKLTAAPFHLWAPSIYGNSPLPTITILSIFSKLTIIFLFINLMVILFDSYKFIWQPLLFFFGILSVVISILGALTEKYIKRFFVYSSISHIGFIILGITTLNFIGIQASIDYLILYIISSLIIWIILMFLTNKVTHIINLKGLVNNFNVLSLIFVITLFSMGGLPPLGGFFVKFEIFYSLINSNLFFISYILFILTLFNFFYYLRLIKVIYFEDNKTIKKFKNFDSIKLRIISILIFILPLYFILFGESWNFILQQIIIYSLK